MSSWVESPDDNNIKVQIIWRYCLEILPFFIIDHNSKLEENKNAPCGNYFIIHKQSLALLFKSLFSLDH